MRPGVRFTFSCCYRSRARPDPVAPAIAAEPACRVLSMRHELSQDFDRWATRRRAPRPTGWQGQGRDDHSFDPSKPYAEQFTPLKLNGELPTEKQLKSYRLRGENRGKRSRTTKRPARRRARRRTAHINGQNARSIFRTRHTRARRRRPSRSHPAQARREDVAPVEKFELLARVNKSGARLKTCRRLRTRSHEAHRESPEGEGTSTSRSSIEIRAPAIGIQGRGMVSVMFVKFGGNFDVKRTEFLRVNLTATNSREDRR